MKIQDYYCKWRKKNINEPVIDDSPSFVKESALNHFDIVEQMFDHQRFLYYTYLDYELDDPGTLVCITHKCST